MMTKTGRKKNKRCLENVESTDLEFVQSETLNFVKIKL